MSGIQKTNGQQGRNCDLAILFATSAQTPNRLGMAWQSACWGIGSKHNGSLNLPLDTSCPDAAEQDLLAAKLQAMAHLFRQGLKTPYNLKVFLEDAELCELITKALTEDEPFDVAALLAEKTEEQENVEEPVSLQDFFKELPPVLCEALKDLKAAVTDHSLIVVHTPELHAYDSKLAHHARKSLSKREQARPVEELEQLSNGLPFEMRYAL